MRGMYTPRKYNTVYIFWLLQVSNEMSDISIFFAYRLCLLTSCSLRAYTYNLVFTGFTSPSCNIAKPDLESPSNSIDGSASTALSQESSASSKGPAPPPSGHIMTTKDLSPTFEAKSRGKSHESISAKPPRHDAHLALSPYDKAVANGQGSPPAQSSSISNPKGEVARKNHGPSSTSSDGLDPLKDPAPYPESSLACGNRGPTRALVAPPPYNRIWPRALKFSDPSYAK